MKKGIIIVLFTVCITTLFANEMNIAKQFIDDNGLLTGYNILDLNMNTDNTKTFLFYKPYNNIIIGLNDPVLAFTDAIIIKTNNEIIIQYLLINQSGLVKTNDDIRFYDFSERGYSHIKFNGWLLNTKKMDFENSNINAFDIQMTNDGINPIPADPQLPTIIWDYKFNYPVKYEFTMYPLPSPTWMIEYEWREDIKTSCARTGLRDDRLLNYIKELSDYERRIIINTMFALYGYEFKTTEWKDYFSKFLWYKPDSNVMNNIEILDEYQKRLYEYLIK